MELLIWGTMNSSAAIRLTDSDYRSLMFDMPNFNSSVLIADSMRRAVQILLGHTNIENTVRYLGVDVDDALTLSERTDI